MSAANTPTTAVARERRPKMIVNQSHLAGSVWFIGWLFTIGFAKLVWWQIILGLVVWPYYLALALRGG
jgi:hypothetical protein